MINGEMYGLPFNLDVYGLTWNKAMFKQAGLDPSVPPTTWSQLRDYAKKLTVRRSDGSIERVGYGIRYTGQPHGVVHKWIFFLWQTGADLIDPPDALEGGKAAFNTPQGRSAAQLIIDMLYTDKSTAFGFPDPKEAFLQGLAAMQTSEVSTIINMINEYKVKMDWGMVVPPIPDKGGQKVSNLGGWQWVVSAGSKNKEAAYKLLEYLASPEVDYAMSKAWPGLTPKLKETFGKAPFNEDDFYIAQNGIMKYGQAYPRNVNLNEVMAIMGTYLVKSWQRELSVEDAFNRAEAEINRVLSRKR